MRKALQRPFFAAPLALTAQAFWRLQSRINRFANEIIQGDTTTWLKNRIAREEQAGIALPPEADIKALIQSAQTLADVWAFFERRLHLGSTVELMLFSVLDNDGNSIALRHWFPAPQPGAAEPLGTVLVAARDEHNHLSRTLQRRDTTFTPRVKDLGEDILARCGWDASLEPTLSIFTIPLIAGNRPVALLTIGFGMMDAFSQNKLAYLYRLRDHLAQLVWNLLLQEQVSDRRRHDSLTGLYGHSYFQNALAEHLGEALHHNRPLSVLLVELSNLRTVNETFGHEAGDQALRQVVWAIQDALGGKAILARYGVDEFGIILPQTSAEACPAVAADIVEQLERHCADDGFSLLVAIGYAGFPDHGTTHNLIRQHAEKALSIAKLESRARQTSYATSYEEARQLDEKQLVQLVAAQIETHFNNETIGLLETLMDRLENPQTHTQPLQDAVLETVSSLSGALRAKDQYTQGHSHAVANYAVAMAQAVGMAPEALEHLRMAAFLHDIGKIGIPEQILCKPGPLSPEEWEVMNRHPVIGAQQILAPISAMAPLIPMVRHHHEHWDGTGGPDGLAGSDIPLGARIISIVDAYHALTSDRPYRTALSVRQACEILQAGAGTKWDPALIDTFLGLLETEAPATTAPCTAPGVTTD